MPSLIVTLKDLERKIQELTCISNYKLWNLRVLEYDTIKWGNSNDYKMLNVKSIRQYALR